MSTQDDSHTDQGAVMPTHYNNDLRTEPSKSYASDYAEDHFEAAAKLDAILYAFEARSAGVYAHSVVDVRVLAALASLDLAHGPLPTGLLGRVTELASRIASLTQARRDELAAALTQDHRTSLWRPQRGSQAAAWEALHSPATQVLLAGSAGSGKTTAALMACALSSRAARIVRKSAGEMTPLWAELTRLLGGDTSGRNLATGRWELAPPFGRNNRGTTIQFFATGEPGAERMSAAQGNAVGLAFYDDVGSGWLSPDQLEFLSRWTRSTVEPARTVMTANPPTSIDGEWLRALFAPWLDSSHPHPARSGEVRHMIGSEVVDAGTPGAIARVCVTSTVQDGNPFLMRAGYLDNLNAISDPVLRAKLRDNDWNTAGEDDPYQLVPTRWLDAAFERYDASKAATAHLTACGLDVARGGRDFSVLAKMHGTVIPPLLRWPGYQTPDGHSLAALVLNARGNNKAHVAVDAIGVGSGAVDALRPRIFEQCVAVNVAAGTKILDSTGTWGFANVRAWLGWNLRCLLDPSNPNAIAIAPDKALRVELLAYRYSIGAGKIALESKDDIQRRIHRSPDAASAVMLAAIPVESTLVQQSSFARAIARSQAAWVKKQQEQQQA